MNGVCLSELFSELLECQVYILNFPQYQEGTFIKFEITSGVQEVGGVYDFSIQFMVKSKEPSESERVALGIIDTLDMLTDIDFGDGKYQLVLLKATSPQPYFVGETETNEYIFSTDFRLLVNKL